MNETKNIKYYYRNYTKKMLQYILVGILYETELIKYYLKFDLYP
jgi:hypothetical protein